MGLGLSTEDFRVEVGWFIVTNCLVKEDAKIEGEKKLWQKADNGVIITMQLQFADVFVISDETLCSDFVPEKSVVHYFHIKKGGGDLALRETEKEKLGIGDSIMRMVCSLAKR